MKKIAICTPGFLPVPDIKGGAVEHLLTKILDINEKRKQLEIDLYTIHDDKLNNLSYSNVKIHQIKENKFEKIICKILNKLFNIFKINMQANLYGRKISKLLKNKKFDYIVIENNMYLFKSISSRCSKDNRYIYHLHNDIGGNDKPYRLCNYIANRAEVIVTCSNYLKERFFNVTRFDNIQVLYNSIELENFNLENIDIRSEIRNEWSISDDAFVFMYIGRISPEKGLYELVKAFDKVLAKNSNMYLVIVGEAPDEGFCLNSYYKAVLNIANKHKKNIIFQGKKPNEEIPKIMNASDCIIVPTIIEEAFGIVAIEAMACKKPLIVTNSGGLVEVVNEKCSYIVDKNNIVDELIDKIQIISNNKDKALKMGEFGRERIELIEDFHIENYYDNFINILLGINN
ncbi:glycosyltransferase family 4 protein [Clostridium disporicum]|uniref:Glycosyltransferase n=1 Tax=Clostridium disporicum TaxID=84024 RepID=A0A174L6C7_9CLOT|nr:glycosyltransferase family 4 protein [Clostridium disporicum]CUP17345.1 glycosyltransferase [Clostridium disporicum]